MNGPDDRAVPGDARLHRRGLVVDPLHHLELLAAQVGRAGIPVRFGGDEERRLARVPVRRLHHQVAAQPGSRGQRGELGVAAGLAEHRRAGRPRRRGGRRPDAAVADDGNNVVREVNLLTGVITTVAGDGTAGYSGDGGPATAAASTTPAEWPWMRPATSSSMGVIAFASADFVSL